MKYTAVLSLFLAVVAVADLPYGMPNGKREVDQHPPVPDPTHTATHHHSGHPPGTGGPPPGTGGHPPGTGGPFPTGTGGGGHHNHPPHTIKQVDPKPTTLKTHTHKGTGYGTGGPHGTGHGTGGHHGTGGPHGTGHGTGGPPHGTGKPPHPPSETDKWTWPKPSAMTAF